jgi:hypothetical protein
MAARSRIIVTTVSCYLDERFTIRRAAGDAAGRCTLSPLDAVSMTVQECAPTSSSPAPSPAGLERRTSCAAPCSPTRRYVTGNQDDLTYDIDLHAGSAALTRRRPSSPPRRSTWDRFVEFFRLGAEHLLTGIDHILFLLALIAGSRKLREIVLGTVFTLLIR